MLQKYTSANPDVPLTVESDTDKIYLGLFLIRVCVMTYRNTAAVVLEG